jgi:hypothetical protein
VKTFTALAAALALAGCIGTGTETGNPGQTTTQAQVGLSAFTGDPMAVTLPDPTLPEEPDAIQILEAWVSVRKIELVRQAVCDVGGEQELEIRGLVGDLAAGPVLSELKVPVTEYCEVEVELRKPEDDAPASPLGDDTLQITGLRSDGIPFELASRRDFELELKSRGQPFSIDRTRAALLVAFDVVRWFDDVNLDQAAVDGEGSGAHIRIDRNRNEDLLLAFENSVRRSLGVYRDDDEDGHVGEDERESLTDDE